MQITYAVHSSMHLLAQRYGFTVAEMNAHLNRGMAWWTQIWNHTVKRVLTNAKPRFYFYCTDNPDPRYPYLRNSFAWYQAPYVVFNGRPISGSTGKVVPHTLAGIEYGTAHETGHGLITRAHLTSPPYYGEKHFGHVMAITSFAFQYAFSPLEIHFKRSWGVKAAQAWHPFVHTWLAMTPAQRTANLAKLKKIVGPYYELGISKSKRLHSLIGVPVIDDYLRSLPYKTRPDLKRPAPLSARAEVLAATDSETGVFNCGLCAGRALRKPLKRLREFLPILEARV